MVFSRWYSWTIHSLVNGVYAFGFLFMLPQLFINYHLKSVAHIPWRSFMYKVSQPKPVKGLSNNVLNCNFYSWFYVPLLISGNQYIYWWYLCFHNFNAHFTPGRLLQRWCCIYNLSLPALVSFRHSPCLCVFIKWSESLQEIFIGFRLYPVDQTRKEDGSVEEVIAKIDSGKLNHTQQDQHKSKPAKNKKIDWCGSDSSICFL